MTPREQRLLKRHRGSWVAPEEEAGMMPAQQGAATAPSDDGLSDMQLEVALYIESISAELRHMAKAADLEALSYFLEMARIEASIQVERRALSLSE